jgi:AGZA family xanthine/uracil permease-like MFS transporter
VRNIKKLTKSQLKNEFIGGFTSFLATFYIIIVNPAILSQAGLSFQAVTTATILLTAFSTILMGLYANNPIVLAPGMGLNAFFTYTVIIGQKIPTDVALGIVFWSGIIFILLSIFNIREKIIRFIDPNLKHSITCGIGLFIAFIGLINGGVISKHPVTLVTLSPYTAITISFFISLLVSALLVIKKYHGALIYGIIFTTILAFPIGRWYGDASLINFGQAQLIQWKGLIAWPDFSLFLQLDLIGALKLSFIPVVLSFVFTDLFDTISTLIGVCETGNLLDKEGNPRNLKKSLIVDAVATTASGLIGSSPTTSFIESAAGVQAGAKTGWASVFTGLLFLPFLFFSPLLSMFPNYTTAPVLVIVGLFMMSSVSKIEWKKLEVAIPSFICLLLIPLSFSITKGILWGMISFEFIRCFHVKKSLPVHLMILAVLLALTIFGVH